MLDSLNYFPSSSCSNRWAAGKGMGVIKSTWSWSLQFEGYNPCHLLSSPSLHVSFACNAAMPLMLVLSSSGTPTTLRELEREVAHFVGKEDAVIFNMGYNTNGSAIPSLVGTVSCLHTPIQLLVTHDSPRHVVCRAASC